jgi:hypothetical protein
VATPEDIIEARRIANARATAKAAVTPVVSTPAVDPYYVRDPKTGLSPAQVEANKIVAETAKAVNAPVVTGDAGTTNRVFTPYEKGSTSYLGKEYATAAGAYTAAVKAAEKVGPPGPAPTGLHWNLQGTEWKLYDAEGKPFNYLGSNTQDFTGEGSANSPLLYKGKPFNGTRGGITYVNGIPKGVDGKKEDKRVTNPDGSITIYYNDGTTSTIPAKSAGGGNNEKTLVETKTDPKTGDVIGIFSDGSTQVLLKGAGPQADKEYIDAYALLESVFRDYGLEELVPNIKRYMEQGIGSKQATVELKETQAYKTRFAGNEMRRAAGKNVLDEATYLALENSYDEALRSYGLQNYFGIDRKKRNARMAEFIGNDINYPEFKDRIDLAVNRVNMADPFVKSTLVSFYKITDNDLVNYFLNPKEGLPILEEKVKVAEIGGVAAGLGLQADLTSALGLTKLGVTKARAQEGYKAIAEKLPRGKELSEIYKEEAINYGQGIAEEAEFRGTASAKRAEERLRGREISSFSGGAGTGRTSLTRGSAGLI